MTTGTIPAKLPEAAPWQPSPLYRWIVLLFVSLTMGCNYYIYDSINPLQHVFIQRLGFTATMFGWLNSAYAVTAILTLLIGVWSSIALEPGRRSVVLRSFAFVEQPSPQSADDQPS